MVCHERCTHSLLFIEYALIFGLRCSSYLQDWKNFDSNSFSDRHFKDVKKVSIKDVNDKLLKMQDLPKERQNTKKQQNALCKRKGKLDALRQVEDDMFVLCNFSANAS